jgi:hypothetical protein
MECYEGAQMIKTFRGKIADGGQDTIVLHTNDGSTGYRILKFEIMPPASGTIAAEYCAKIFKVQQSSVDGAIDFSDQTLLAAATLKKSGTLSHAETPLQVIFDKEIFNQDVYVTNFDADSSNAINYYIELEQVKLNLNESTVATLKDIRNIKRTATG